MSTRPTSRSKKNAHFHGKLHLSMTDGIAARSPQGPRTRPDVRPYRRMFSQAHDKFWKPDILARTHLAILDVTSRPRGKIKDMFENMKDEKMRFSVPDKVQGWRDFRSAHAKSIFDSYEKLSAIIATHEETIVRRWSKKTTKARLSLMTEAWPGNHFLSKRRDWAFVQSAYNHQVELIRFPLKRTTKYWATAFDVNTFFSPYLNAEDLHDRRALLTLLFARGTNHPVYFIDAEQRAMVLGVEMGLSKFDIQGTDEMVAYFRHTRDWRQYVGLRDPEKLLAKDHVEGTMTTPVMAILMLECQKRSMDFCCACVQLILHDISPTTMALAVKPINTPDREWLNRESPLFTMSGTGCAEIDELISARCDHYGDLLRNLREDPGFYADHMNFLYDDVQLASWQPEDQVGPIFHELSAIVDCAELWMSLSKKWDQTYRVVVADVDEAGCFSILTQKQLDTLLLLSNDLQRIAMELWWTLIRHADDFSFGYRAEAVRSRRSTQESRQRQAGDAEVDMQHFVRVAMHAWIFGSYAMIDIGDELQKYLESDAAALVRNRNVLLTLATEICQISSCMKKIDFRVRNSLFSEMCIPDEIARGAIWDLSITRHLEDRCGDKLAKTVQSYGVVGTAISLYPVHKRRTAATVKTMQQAEKVLDMFWTHVIHNLGRTSTYPEVIALLKDRSKRLQTPDYLEQEDVAVNRKDTVDVVQEQFSELYFDLQYRTEKTLEQHSAGLTPLRRLRSSIDQQAAQEEDDKLLKVPSNDAQPLVAVQRIAVDKAALSVFQTIFNTPRDDREPGEIPWIKFLHAMTSAGFAAHKMQGSAWHFSPVRLELDRSIHFHEPHPIKKLRFFVAKGIGRRLNRAFGWTADTFVLALKDSTNKNA